jgi:hypothetical protein
MIDENQNEMTRLTDDIFSTRKTKRTSSRFEISNASTRVKEECFSHIIARSY